MPEANGLTPTSRGIDENEAPILDLLCERVEKRRALEDEPGFEILFVLKGPHRQASRAWINLVMNRMDKEASENDMDQDGSKKDRTRSPRT